MQSSKTTPTTRGPLSSMNLLLAGVPAGDVIWFRRLGPGEQMRALQSERGLALLNKVRAYQERSTAGAAMPMPA